MRGHEQYSESLPAHALDALETAEARDLESHLEVCDLCRKELDAWRGTVATLAYDPPAVEPSAEVRSRILAAIHEEKLQGASRLDLGHKREDYTVRSSSVESNVVPFAEPARRGWNAASKFGALAASVAFVALVISLILLWNRYKGIQQEVTRLSDRLNQTQVELTRERESLAREREAIDLVTAPDTRVSTLAGTEVATSAHAKFVLDRKTGKAMLMAYNLPSAPAGKAYQLWYLAEGKPPMPGHVFTPDAEGHVEMHEEVPAEARDAKVFAVTLEPSAGAQTPTKPIYLVSATS